MPVLNFTPTPIAGCYEIQPVIRSDERGYFVKTFYAPEFADLNLEHNFVEEYYSSSHLGVIRGMHFQLPPHDHAKLVYCISGSVMDVIIDLRIGSPTFKQLFSTYLNAENAKMLYVPRGFAHGFEALKNKTVMVYKVTSTYTPEHDGGIRFDSIDTQWSTQNPTISTRDLTFPTLDQFKSRFIFQDKQ
jgi:dTDP-4-dehydrorhamnose 3,5-epimerase